MLVGWLLLSLLTACNSKGAKQCAFTVINSTPYRLDSVRITSNGLNGLLTNLQPGEKTQKSFPMSYSGSYEGAFLASVFVKDSAVSRRTFGYFSNGGDIKADYTIEIGEGFTIKER